VTTITGKLSGSFSFDHLFQLNSWEEETPMTAHRTAASTLPVPPWISESVDSVGEWLADIEAGLDLGNGISRSSLIVALKSAGRWPRQIPEAVYLLVFRCRLGAHQGTRSLHFDVPDPDAFNAAEELLARVVAQLIPMHELQWRALREQARAWSMTTDKAREQIALFGVRHAVRLRLNRQRRARFGAENQRVQLAELMWPNFPAFVYVVLNRARNFARRLLDSWADDTSDVKARTTNKDAAARANVSFDSPDVDGGRDSVTLHELVPDLSTPAPDVLALDRVAAGEAIRGFVLSARQAGMPNAHIVRLEHSARLAMAEDSNAVLTKERMRHYRFRRSAAAKAVRHGLALRGLAPTS
jgi:hypothetical protein